MVMFAITDYDYHLPPERVAQFPLDRKDHSRLLRLRRQTGQRSHHRFFELEEFLAPGDVLVVNDTRVIPGRLLGFKETGGRVEALILDYPGRVQHGSVVCHCLVKASRGLAPGSRLVFEERLPAEVMAGGQGRYEIRFDCGRELEAALETVGRVPLPPYIQRGQAPSSAADRSGYQTVYAREKGAVAAPTAGLHFTEDLLASIENRGVTVAPITL
ncbi:MAG: S-adenosylmethionine:tRNA ribosyltransferase-isomerase, partial [Desulfosudaceae bacterium]